MVDQEENWRRWRKWDRFDVLREVESVRGKERVVFNQKRKKKNNCLLQRVVGAHQFGLTWCKQDNGMGPTCVYYYKNAT